MISRKFKQPLYIAATYEAQPTPADELPKKYHYVRIKTNGQTLYLGPNGQLVENLSSAIPFVREEQAIGIVNAVKDMFGNVNVFSCTPPQS